MSINWLTTAPNPRVVSYTADAGQRGWRTHAVASTAETKFADIRWTRSACGLLPAHGWSIDLFIEQKCARCLVATGLACPHCRGRGSTGKVFDGTYDLCHTCMGTGERGRSSE